MATKYYSLGSGDGGNDTLSGYGWGNALYGDAGVDTMKQVIQIFLFVLLVLTTMALSWRQYVMINNTAVTQEHLVQFKTVEGLDFFEQSRPQIFTGVKAPHAVLLLHGYSGSTYEWKTVVAGLKAAGIPYYAPLMTGYGLNNFDLLSSVKAADWLRDAENAYQVLAAIADEVSVVGHSTGANLAIHVASRNPVKHLVLSGPNLYPAASDGWVKSLTDTPVLGSLIAFLHPVFVKPTRPGRTFSVDTLDPANSRNTLTYPTLPSGTLKEMYAVQDTSDITKAQFEDLTILYGEQDMTVDNASALSHLDAINIPYQVKTFANSAHNIYQDYDYREAVTYLVQMMSQD